MRKYPDWEKAFCLNRKKQACIFYKQKENASLFSVKIFATIKTESSESIFY